MDFNETKYAEIAKSSPEKVVEFLIEQGYKQTSRKYRCIARINLPENDIEKMDWSTQEYYRRCTSTDTIENVPEIIMELLR